MSKILKEAFNEVKNYKEALGKNAKKIATLENKKKIDRLVKESLDEIDNEEDLDMEGANSQEGKEDYDSMTDEEVEQLYNSLKTNETDDHDMDDMGFDDEDEDEDLDGMVREMENMVDEDDDEMMEIDLDSIEDDPLSETDDYDYDDDLTKDYDSYEEEVGNEEDELVEDIMAELREMGLEDDEEGLEENMGIQHGVGTRTKHSPDIKNAGKSRHPHPNTYSKMGESKETKKLMIENKTLTEKTDKLVLENRKLRDGIKKLNENFKTMRLFSDNLVNITKLFTENNVSSKDKQYIIESFDKVKTLEESQKMYQSLTKRLNTTKNNTIVKENLANSATAKAKIVETKSFEKKDEAFDRMLSLMKYDTNKSR